MHRFLSQYGYLGAVAACLVFGTAMTITLAGCPIPGTGGTTLPGVSGNVTIPADPGPQEVTVDGQMVSVNVNLSEGAWQWFKFTATAGQQYYLMARGDAPLIMMLFEERAVGEEEDDVVATLIWTTEPSREEIDYFPVYAPCDDCKSAKVMAVPSFIAPADGTYYVVLQAARVDSCFPDCSDEDLLYALYYDVRTVSLEITTVDSPDTATQITPANPENDPAFLKGEVNITKLDWFFFNATAESSYMIEFRAEHAARDVLAAIVYGPNGDVVCEVLPCAECDPTPLFAPLDGRYYVLVAVDEDLAPDGSGNTELEPDVEWGTFEYLLRVLNDDHGNAAAVATQTDSPDMNDEVELDGYLSFVDNDWLSFAAAPYSTYRVETNSNSINLDLGAPDATADLNDIDGFGNDTAVFRNDGRREEIFPYRILPVYVNDVVQADDPNLNVNPFRLEGGDYSVIIYGDDHVDFYPPTLENATPLPIGGSETGLLWPTDEDLFQFTPAQAPFMYRASSTGANDLEVVDGAAGQADEFDATKSVSVDHTSEDTEDPVLILLSGVDEDVYEVDFTVGLVGEDHINQDPEADFDQNAAAASEIEVNGSEDGTLWPTDDDLFAFELRVARARVGRVHRVTLAEGAEGLPPATVAVATELQPWPDVDGNGIVNVLEDADGQPVLIDVIADPGNEEDVDYTIEVDVDDYSEEVDSDLAADLDDLQGEIWPTENAVADRDVFLFSLDAGDDTDFDLTALGEGATLSYAVTLEDGTPTGIAGVFASGDDELTVAVPAPGDDTDYALTIFDGGDGSGGSYEIEE